MKRPRTHILKLDADDADRELEFELDFLSSLTMRQRYDMMFTRSRQVAEALARQERRAGGRRECTQVTKRA